MEALAKLVHSKWFLIIYIIGAVGLLFYLRYDFPKIVFHYISFFLAIRLLANKKWIQLIVLITLIIAVTVGITHLGKAM